MGRKPQLLPHRGIQIAAGYQALLDAFKKRERPLRAGGQDGKRLAPQTRTEAAPGS